MQSLIEFVNTGYFSDKLPICQATSVRDCSRHLASFAHVEGLYLLHRRASRQQRIRGCRLVRNIRNLRSAETCGLTLGLAGAGEALANSSASDAAQGSADDDPSPTQRSRFNFVQDDGSVAKPSGQAPGSAPQEGGDPIFVDPAIKHAVVRSQPAAPQAGGGGEEQPAGAQPRFCFKVAIRV